MAGGANIKDGDAAALSGFQAYVYRQYQDDDDVQAFRSAFNQAASGFVQLFQTLNLPVYAGNPLIVGELLDWVGQGLYGIPRPTIPLGTQQVIGPFDTYGFATGPDLASQKDVGTVPYVLATDDVYKRVLTWHHWRGDGRQFTVPWLKRRVARFLYGVDGTGFADLGLLANVSVQAVRGLITITVAAAPGSDAADVAQILQDLIYANLVELPMQYEYVVHIVQSYTAELGFFVLGRNSLAYGNQRTLPNPIATWGALPGWGIGTWSKAP